MLHTEITVTRVCKEDSAFFLLSPEKFQPQAVLILSPLEDRVGGQQTRQKLVVHLQQRDRLWILRVIRSTEPHSQPLCLNFTAS